MTDFQYIKIGCVAGIFFTSIIGLVAQIAAEQLPLLVLMRDQKENASVPHPQLEGI